MLMSVCVRRTKPWCPLMHVYETSDGTWDICRASSYNRLISNSVKTRKVGWCIIYKVNYISKSFIGISVE